jgi:hypothetical protein
MAEEKRSREKLTVAVDPPVRQAPQRRADELDVTPGAAARQVAEQLGPPVADQPTIRLTAAIVLRAAAMALCALSASARMTPLTSTKRWRPARWPQSQFAAMQQSFRIRRSIGPRCRHCENGAHDPGRIPLERRNGDIIADLHGGGAHSKDGLGSSIEPRPRRAEASRGGQQWASLSAPGISAKHKATFQAIGRPPSLPLRFGCKPRPDCASSSAKMARFAFQPGG